MNLELANIACGIESCKAFYWLRWFYILIPQFNTVCFKVQSSKSAFRLSYGKYNWSYMLRWACCWFHRQIDWTRTKQKLYIECHFNYLWRILFQPIFTNFSNIPNRLELYAELYVGVNCYGYIPHLVNTWNVDCPITGFILHHMSMWFKTELPCLSGELK